MSKIHAIYQRLRSVSNDSVDRALIAALPTADPLAVKLLGLTLLERRRPDGMLCLVNNFHLLTYDVQTLLVHHFADFHHTLRLVCESPGEQGPANAVEIIARSKSLRMSYLLVDMLRHAAPTVRTKATAGLLEFAKGVAGDESEPDSTADDPDVATSLTDSLTEALTLYRHHMQRDVLRAIAVLAPRPMHGVVRVLQDRSNPAVPDMRAMLEAADSVEVRRSLLMFTRVSSLSDAALAGIQKSGVRGVRDVIHSSHLLLVGPVARAVQKLPEPDRICPKREELFPYKPATRRMAPRWIAALPLEPGRQVEALASIAHDRDAATRLAALRQLIAMSDRPEGQAADGAISLFTTDADIRLARIALQHLVRHRWTGLPRLLLTLVNSPHGEIRHLAGAHLAPLGFAKYWDSWPKLSYAQRLAGGQALIKLDANFHRLLGDRLGRPDRAARLRAMAMIHGLNQGAFFEAPLLALARDSNEVIAASAVRALGSAPAPEVIDALEQALQHANSRVRANAVESLQQIQSTRHVQRLLEMAHEEDSRPRANAIHALMEMRTTEALAALNTMLADQRPAQRVSALWLVDHLGVVEMARHVAELAVADPDPAVKDRANSVIHRLIESLHPPAPSQDVTHEKAEKQA